MKLLNVLDQYVLNNVSFFIHFLMYIIIQEREEREKYQKVQQEKVEYRLQEQERINKRKEEEKKAEEEKEHNKVVEEKKLAAAELLTKFIG